jgi:hypothetical protein
MRIDLFRNRTFCEKLKSSIGPLLVGFRFDIKLAPGVTLPCYVGLKFQKSFFGSERVRQEVLANYWFDSQKVWFLNKSMRILYYLVLLLLQSKILIHNRTTQLMFTLTRDLKRSSRHPYPYLHRLHTCKTKCASHVATDSSCLMKTVSKLDTPS